VVVVSTVLFVVVVVGITTCGGGSDGPAAFLSREGPTIIFVQWTRVGEDLSGTVSETKQTGELEQETAPFTGTVRDDSVRLEIGSGAATGRINGRLDGDTLELTIPQEEGVQTRRLTPAGKDDYTQAVQDLRDREKRRREAAQAAADRRYRAVRSGVTPVATAFQKALDPASSDDPCRYMRPQLKRELVARANADARSGNGPAGRSCVKIVRYYEAELTEGPQGVARVELSDPSPPDAVVVWRQDPNRVRLEAKTPFAEENGRWLLYHCCRGLLGQAGQ
jgi:hypothetical protein